MTKQDSPFDHTGSSFDSFLEEDGNLEEVETAAAARVAEWQAGHSSKAPECGGETSIPSSRRDSGRIRS